MPDTLESWLKEHAVYSPTQAHEAPMAELWEHYAFDELSSGLQARVFRVRDEQWVMKEGRWDLDIHLFGNVRMPLPAQLTEDIWKQFSQTFLPRKEEILRQYGLYLQFSEYFGFFDQDGMPQPVYHHPKLDTIVARQREVRDTLPSSLHDLREDYGMVLPDSLHDLLGLDELKYHNFLPKEYLLIGPSLSPQNKGKTTFFVFQEYVPGRHLHDIDIRELATEHRRQCALLLVLMLLAHRERKLLPDTRPRFLVTEIYDWLTKTDNIILSADGLKYIDTRWFWETETNLVKRGLFVPEVVIGQARKLLQELSHDLD